MISCLRLLQLCCLLINIHSYKLYNFKKSVILSGLSVILVIAPIDSAYAKSFPKCVTESNPQTTTISCRQLGLKDDGRLNGCQANENCFSTSATAASKYSSPWQYSTTFTTDEAYLLLKAAVQSSGLKILQANQPEYYLLAAEKGSDNVSRQGKPQPAGSSLFYEFLLRPQEKLVLYRAVVDKTVFVYPLQQPVTDFGVLKEKLAIVLSKTGWRSIAASGEGDDTMQQKMDSAKQNLWNTFI